VINGHLIDGRPFVQVYIELPRIGVARTFDFLIDTGSDVSLIGPSAAADLGIEYSRDFPTSRRTTSIGTGGTSVEFREGALLELRHHDGQRELLGLTIGIALPTATNIGMPPIIGLDILRTYRLTFEPHSGLVQLEEPFGP
jgi:predicted aspartyl protease